MMKILYISPEAEMVEFDTKDVITTSGDSGFGTLTGEVANQDAGWTGLF